MSVWEGGLYLSDSDIVNRLWPLSGESPWEEQICLPQQRLGMQARPSFAVNTVCLQSLASSPSSRFPRASSVPSFLQGSFIHCTKNGYPGLCAPALEVLSCLSTTVTWVSSQIIASVSSCLLQSYLLSFSFMGQIGLFGSPLSHKPFLGLRGESKF